MKLYRFNASSTERAIFTVTESLGPNALIYSTRKVPGGVEVLAGLPFGADAIIDHYQFDEYDEMQSSDQDEVKVQEAALDNSILENLNVQIQTMNKSIQILSESITVLQKTFLERNKYIKFLRWLLLTKITFPRLPKIMTHRRELTN